MVKFKDLGVINKGQMSRQLVYWYVVLSTYQKWSKEGQLLNQQMPALVETCILLHSPMLTPVHHHKQLQRTHVHQKMTMEQ